MYAIYIIDKGELLSMNIKTKYTYEETHVPYTLQCIYVGPKNSRAVKTAW